MMYISLQVPIHHFAEHCQRRLEKTMQSGAKRGIRKPSLDEIEQAKVRHYRNIIRRGFAAHCQRRLEKTMQYGAKRGVHKPLLDEIEQAMVRHCSLKHKTRLCRALPEKTMQSRAKRGICKPSQDEIGQAKVSIAENLLDQAHLYTELEKKLVSF